MSMIQSTSRNGANFGILRPQMTYRFMVTYHVVFDPTEDCSEVDASHHLAHLTQQTVSVSQPKQVFPIQSLPRRARKPFVDIATEGELSVLLENDATNLVAEALDFLQRNDVTKLRIVVTKLDDSENVLEAYVYSNAKLKSIEQSDLDYSGRVSGMSGSLNGQMIDKTSEAISINANITLGNGAISTKRLSFQPAYVQRVHYQGAALPTLDDFLKGLS